MLRVRGRRKVMDCAFCGRQKPWPDSFVNSTYAQCFTCWLKDHPQHIEPMRLALQEVHSAEHRAE